MAWRVTELQSDSLDVHLERVLSAVISSIFSKPMATLMCAKSMVFDPKRQWFYFQSVEAAGFAICLTPLCGIFNQVIYLKKALQFSSALAKSNLRTQSGFAPRLMLALDKLSPIKQWQFGVYDQEKGFVGEVYYAQNQSHILSIGDDYVTPSWETPSALDAELVLILDRGLAPSASVISMDLPEFGYLLFSLGTRTCRLPVTFNIHNGLTELRVIYKEVFMDSNQGENEVLELSIGKIEIPIGQLVRLRPGMLIEFEGPTQGEGILRLNRQDWATVAVQFEGGKVRLEIKALQFNAQPIKAATGNFFEKSSIQLIEGQKSSSI